MGIRKMYKITKPIELFIRANALRKEKGLFYIIHFGVKIIIDKIINYFWCYLVYKPFKSFRTFSFQDKNYNYFYHTYNSAWKNERTVEIPIILKILRDNKSTQILEIGNVLSHYTHTNHDIIDKYEKSDGVTNQDVIEFRTEKKYDLIISISTIEHIGLDEKSRNKNKIPEALRNLESMLNDEGKIIITFLLGYNIYLDTLLKDNNIEFTHIYCLKKTTKNNAWKETAWEKIKDTKNIKQKNLLIIGVIEKIKSTR